MNQIQDTKIKNPSQENQKASSKKMIIDFLRSFLMPTFIGKTLVLYFGIHYSMYPDEGYGYGLVASIAFTVISLCLFMWKYRNYEDEDDRN